MSLVPLSLSLPAGYAGSQGSGNGSCSSLEASLSSSEAHQLVGSSDEQTSARCEEEGEREGEKEGEGGWGGGCHVACILVVIQ